MTYSNKFFLRFLRNEYLVEWIKEGCKNKKIIIILLSIKLLSWLIQIKND